MFFSILLLALFLCKTERRVYTTPFILSALTCICFHILMPSPSQTILTFTILTCLIVLLDRIFFNYSSSLSPLHSSCISFQLRLWWPYHPFTKLILYTLIFSYHCNLERNNPQTHLGPPSLSNYILCTLRFVVLRQNQRKKSSLQSFRFATHTWKSSCKPQTIAFVPS